MPDKTLAQEIKDHIMTLPIEEREMIWIHANIFRAIVATNPEKVGIAFALVGAELSGS